MDRRTILEQARIFRKNPTREERILWSALRVRRLGGMKFLRQHPIEYEMNGVQSFFLVDFYCYEKRLVIEPDGKIHEFQKERDAERDTVLRTLGLNVVHIGNEEVKSIEKLLSRINCIMESVPLVESSFADEAEYFLKHPVEREAQ